jgi:hypothetical protein
MFIAVSLAENARTNGAQPRLEKPNRQTRERAALEVDPPGK